MLNGLEAEVALVVDVMLSTERLVDAPKRLIELGEDAEGRAHLEA